MMQFPKFIAGDIVLFHNNDWLARLIRRFSTQPDDLQKTLFNHVGMMVDPVFIIEAKERVVKTPIIKYITNKNVKLLIARPKDLTFEQRGKLADIANGYIGRKYGWWKIALHFSDYYVSRIAGHDTWLFRGIAKNNRYPICSWLVAWVFDKALKWKFNNVPKEACQPDDIGDDILGFNKNRYEIILTYR